MSEYWWRLPLISGAESGQSGESAIDAAISEAFPTPESTDDFAAMSRGLIPSSSGENQPHPELSEDDKQILGEVRRQMANIVTQIQSVVDLETNAFFIWGPGGHGKNWLVRKGLNNAPAVKWTTTDVSAKGLFNLLRDYPSHLHVFEDMEKMYKNSDCQSILRAACGGQSADERWINWEKEGKARETPFQFAGGIIVISNEDPTGGSLKMGAIASRFAPQKWELTEQELIAMIRDIAINTPCKYGFTTDERMEVAEFVISEMANRPVGVYVDLRTYCEHALPAYFQWTQNRSHVHWHEVVKAKIKGGPRRSYAEVERERLILAACEAYFAGDDKSSRVAAWKAKTGLGASQFYEYVREAKESGVFDKYRDKHASDQPD